jgi:predicted NBD/HSP70 family sugar kinase
MVGLIFLTFFVISLLTNVIGPLVPDIIKSFELSLTLVAVRSQGSERDVLEDMFSAIDAVMRKDVAGIGAGVIANGRLYSGRNCGAGEFGMLPYLDRNFEACASGQFFARVHGVSGPELAGRAERGEERALTIFAEFGGHPGEAVKAICYAVDPEVIVLGGSVSKSARFFQAAMWDAFRSFAYSITKDLLKIEVSETENVAILGAAALYYDALAKERAFSFC